LPFAICAGPLLRTTGKKGGHSQNRAFCGSFFGLEMDKVELSRLCGVSENQASHPIYIKVKGQEKYLYRAVDSTGQTIDL
jgi:DDE domain